MIKKERVLALEKALLEYVERYGLTETARQALDVTCNHGASDQSCSSGLSWASNEPEKRE